MLMPYFNQSQLPKDPMDGITDNEREKMKAFESKRGISLERCLTFSASREPSLVLDNFLFLGSMQHATDQQLLQRYQIKHILNVCDWGTKQIIQDNFNVIQIPMADNPETDIKQHFDRTNELLHGFYEKNERCLVHCAAGVSRSATIVLAYLMKYHHNTLDDAYFFLVSKRPQIYPNEGFLLQLIRYENDLIQSREIKPDQSNVNEKNPIETLNEFEKIDK